jgi:hypothetical protein
MERVPVSLPIPLWLLACCAFLSTGTARAQVTVWVWQENKPAEVVYHYRVENVSAEPLLSVNIGVDALTGGRNELTVEPVGFVDDEEAVPADMIGFPLPPGSFSAPPAWTASLILAEHEPGVSLLYSLTDRSAALISGMLRGFSISVPRADAAYRTGNWLVILERGIRVSGKLLPDETDAPAPTAAVSGGGIACAGAPIEIRANLTGNGPWSLGWSDGVNQTAQTATAIRSVTASSTTQYSLVEVRDVNVRGVSSGYAIGTVLQPPTIVTQPASTTVKKGGTATLKVVATGATPFAYQWYRGFSGQPSQPVGTNSDTLTTPKLTSTTHYWVRVSNGCGSAASVTATISVR